MKLQLNRQELAGVIVSAIALILVIALAMYIPKGPRKRYEEARGEAARLRNEVRMMEASRVEEEARLENQQQLKAALESRPANFDFFSFVNNLLQRSELGGRFTLNNSSTRRASPQQPMLELRLQGVNLEEMVGFLHDLYASGNLVVVYKMTWLRPAVNDRGLDCELTLMTVKV